MPQSFVNQATARCSVTGSKFWFNCNPGSPQHWFYLEWVRKCRSRKIMYLHFTMDDNLSLSEDIKARYRSQYSGVFYQRYILGLWTVAEGLFMTCSTAKSMSLMSCRSCLPKAPMWRATLAPRTQRCSCCSKNRPMQTSGSSHVSTTTAGESINGKRPLASTSQTESVAERAEAGAGHRRPVGPAPDH